MWKKEGCTFPVKAWLSMPENVCPPEVKTTGISGLDDSIAVLAPLITQAIPGI